MKNQGEIMEMKRCFADRGEYCTALSKKKCLDCSFYRADLDTAKIEYDIRNYGGYKKV